MNSQQSNSTGSQPQDSDTVRTSGGPFKTLLWITLLGSVLISGLVYVKLDTVLGLGYQRLPKYLSYFCLENLVRRAKFSDDAWRVLLTNPRASSWPIAEAGKHRIASETLPILIEAYEKKKITTRQLMLRYKAYLEAREDQEINRTAWLSVNEFVFFTVLEELKNNKIDKDDLAEAQLLLSDSLSLDQFCSMDCEAKTLSDYYKLLRAIAGKAPAQGKFSISRVSHRIYIDTLLNNFSALAQLQSATPLQQKLLSTELNLLSQGKTNGYWNMVQPFEAFHNFGALEPQAIKVLSAAETRLYEIYPAHRYFVLSDAIEFIRQFCDTDIDKQLAQLKLSSRVDHGSLFKIRTSLKLFKAQKNTRELSQELAVRHGKLIANIRQSEMQKLKAITYYQRGIRIISSHLGIDPKGEAEIIDYVKAQQSKFKAQMLAEFGYGLALASLRRMQTVSDPNFELFKKWIQSSKDENQIMTMIQDIEGRYRQRRINPAKADIALSFIEFLKSEYQSLR